MIEEARWKEIMWPGVEAWGRLFHAVSLRRYRCELMDRFWIENEATGSFRGALTEACREINRKVWQWPSPA